MHDAKKVPKAATIEIDSHVFEHLFKEIGNPSASVIYLYLWAESLGWGFPAAIKSLNDIAKATGLSKSTAQNALKLLNEKGLVKSTQLKASTTPEHKVLRPWVKEVAQKKA